MAQDYGLLARVYGRYRRFLNTDLPECQEIARLLNLAGNCDVASMEQDAILAMFPGGESVVSLPVTDDVTMLETLHVVPDEEPEQPKRGRRKAQPDSDLIEETPSEETE